MMVRAMLGLELAGKRVCDLGCGTGVLAILAERLGAAAVLAIDIDPVAVTNAKENVELNHCQRVTVEKGGTDLDAAAAWDAILANIERNTLVRAMPQLAAALQTGGDLLLSGFVRADEGIMDQAAEQAGLVKMDRSEEGEWAFSQWRKPGGH